MTTPSATLARAPVPSLGVVLVGCPDCRVVLGIDGAPRLRAALAAHRRACPAAADICGGCGCEAELHPRGDVLRCADCLGERLFDEPASPPAPARPQVRVRVVQARRPHGAHHPADGAEPEPAEKAVA